MKIYNLFGYRQLLILAYFLIFLSGNAQVGIGTIDPTTALDVNGAISYREGPALGLNNNNNNNISLDPIPYSVYRITGPTESFNITGIAAVNAADGQIVTLINTTDEIMTILNQNNNSLSQNRIFCAKKSDLMLRGKYASVTLQYTANNKKWIVLTSSEPIETWYVGLVKLDANTAVTYSITFPGATKSSGFTINLIGPAVNNAMINNIAIEYKEVRTDEIIFRVHNSSTNTGYSNIQYAITIYK